MKRYVLCRNTTVRINLSKGTRQNVSIPDSMGAYISLKRGCEQKSWLGQKAGGSWWKQSSPETVITSCITFWLPPKPVKVGQTTLDKLVEILENLLPPTFICVGHFLFKKYDIYTNSGCYSPTHGSTMQISSWDSSLPAGTVIDHEQLHCPTDLLLQGIRFIYNNKVSGKNFSVEFNRLSTASTAWPDLC